MTSRGARAEGASTPVDQARARAQGDELRALTQRFIRAAGLLSGDQTPCGKPLPISHAHALMVLLERGRGGARPSQQELARTLGIDKSNVTRLCRKMASSGHLIQELSGQDGRVRLLKLTERGKRLAESVEAASRDRFERLISAVEGVDRRTVLAGLSILIDALASSSPSNPAGDRRAPP